MQTIHEERIVHSDPKPVNFVLVKGSLKLIDFGIAKAIANDTMNIQHITALQPEIPKLKGNEAIVTEAWLKQMIEDASKKAIENGALDEEAIQQMAL
ncbi:hypothetical protein FRC11_009062, partial [Ceratobasidium sp. 423]